MRVQTTARRCHVPSPVLERAATLVDRLARYNPDLTAGELVFELDSRTHRVEAVLSVRKGDPVVAKAEGRDFRTALDQLSDKLSRILRKRRSLRRDHRGPKLSELPLPEGSGT